MKKSLKICILGLTAMMLAAGCSKKTDTPAESDTTAETAATTAGGETETGTEAPSGPIDPGTVDKLGDYKGVTYTPLAVEVSDDEIEQVIESLLEDNATLQEVDRAAAEGDTVNIDYAGYKDGVAFDGGTAEGFDLTLGSGQFIDGFEDGLIGAEAGQKVSLNLTFPEDYGSEELAGQDVVFEVTVNTVSESVKPELTDEFIASNTDSATVEEYRKVLREEMEEDARYNAEEQKKADVFLKVVADSEVTTPEESVQAMYQQQRASYEQQAQMFGLELELLVGYYGMDMETFETELMEIAREGCKQNAVVQAIAGAENITVEESDLEQLAADFGYEDTASMIENAGEDTVNNYALTEKVVAFLAENAVAEQ